jgi:hypothetical protein
MCTGPSSHECLSCVPNAFKDDHSHCNCSNDWVGSDCTIYIGECDWTCNSCLGPHPFNCINCVEKAEASLVNGMSTCLCLDNWTGIGCTMYSGPCFPLCIGCFGPDEDNCHRCQPNAKEDASGSCVCEEIWHGANCTEFSQ